MIWQKVTVFTVLSIHIYIKIICLWPHSPHIIVISRINITQHQISTEQVRVTCCFISVKEELQWTSFAASVCFRVQCCDQSILITHRHMQCQPICSVWKKRGISPFRSCFHFLFSIGTVLFLSAVFFFPFSFVKQTATSHSSSVCKGYSSESSQWHF